MNKNDFMKINRTKEFINTLANMGYQETVKNGSSHRIFKKSGCPVLSVPNDKILSTGTKRMLTKLILGDKYYE